MLIKVNVEPSQRSEVITTAKIMGAKVANISRSTMTLEISDTAQQLATFEDLLSPYGVKEVVRTGIVAMQRGSEAITLKYK